MEGYERNAKRVLSPTVASTMHVLLEQCHVALKVYMCMVCMALMTTTVLQAKSQDSHVSHTYALDA